MRKLASYALLGLVGFAMTQQPALAQAWPTKPVRVLIGYAGGGPSDLIMRPMAQHLSGVFGQQFFIENKPGANANLGALEVVRAAPDGQTLLFATTSQLTINPALYKMPFDAQKDLLPVIHVSMNPSAVIMNAAFPAATMKEVIAHARANPGKMTYTSAGIGSINHLAAELLSMITKIKMLHVPNKGGGPALNELLAGRVDVFIVSPPLALPHVKSGKLKIMMISAQKRMTQIPDVPTMTEAGFPDFHAQAGTGLLTPAKTPAAIIRRLNAETERYLKSAEGQKQLGSQGVQIIGGTPEQFGKLLREELARWAAVVKAGNIKIE